ncbi:sulfatase-like hydrolase/transferase [Thalassotalea psychrophila]|uniref:Sulfatase-like hydrolase/transferase n=1 Tax=Thalassotalea psychrophila TaxID=3065647 RepID=A0ABY9TWD3_9GAMM|nr:sulfatase-like hydrolase/transferase [Colwelliaceae bacterium SQ149]
MKIDRAKLLTVAVSLGLTLGLSACSESANSTKVAALDSPTANTSAKETIRPNVIVILADDMQRGVTGFEGHPIIKTPNIDKLAKNGTIFNKGFATSAVCTPSRTTLLTGLYERRHGINFNSNSSMTEDAWSQTYPMLLKEDDYFVGWVGKNHTPIGKNEAKGFGYKSGVMDTSFDYWYASHKHLSFYPKDKKAHRIFKNAKADTQIEIIEEGLENFMEPNEAFQAGYNFLDSRPKDQPFALMINFNVPHANSTGSMQMRESDLDLYKITYRDKLSEITIPKTYVAAKDITTPKLPLAVYNGEYIRTYNYVKTPDTLKERKIREMQTISGIDKLLGKLVHNLEKQGIADNTIIVFTSDHGLMHGEFGLGGKVHLYDPSVRIPMVVYDPRMKNKADQSNELVALVDIAPTLLELTNTPVPVEMQGKSLKPLMQETQAKDVEWRQEIFLENMMTIQNYPRMEGVRTHQWKYVRYFDKQKDGLYEPMSVASINGEQPIYEELFDLVNDPDEINNLINEPANQKIVKQLRAKNAELVKEYRGDKPLNTHLSEKKMKPIDILKG